MTIVLNFDDHRHSRSEFLNGQSVVLFVDLEADISAAELLSDDTGGSGTGKRIHDHCVGMKSVEANTHFGQFLRECRRMLLGRPDRIVGNKPDISPVSSVAVALTVFPTMDIGFVGIRHANSKSIQGNRFRLGKMENVFVAVVQVSSAVHRLEMAQVDTMFRNRNRLHPVNSVLQAQRLRDALRHLEGPEFIAGLVPDIEKQGAICLKNVGALMSEFFHPVHIVRKRHPVVMGVVFHPNVVRRRGHDDVDAARVDLRPHSLDAVHPMDHVCTHSASRFAVEICPDQFLDDLRGGLAFAETLNAELGPFLPVQVESGFELGDGITV